MDFGEWGPPGGCFWIVMILQGLASTITKKLLILKGLGASWGSQGGAPSIRRGLRSKAHRLRACVTGYGKEKTKGAQAESLCHWWHRHSCLWGGKEKRKAHRLRACVTGGTDTLVCAGLGRKRRKAHRLRACVTGYGKEKTKSAQAESLCH